MTEPIRFSESITIRCQPEITALVDRAARAKGSKPSEWARQALLAGLRADGFGAARSVNPEMAPGDSETAAGAIDSAGEGVAPINQNESCAFAESANGIGHLMSENRDEATGQFAPNTDDLARCRNPETFNDAAAKLFQPGYSLWPIGHCLSREPPPQLGEDDGGEQGMERGQL